MKPVFIRFTDDDGKVKKTYTVCSLKTGMMDNIFDIAEKASNIQTEEVDIREVREFYRELKALIVTIFKHQFTFEELNEGADNDEIMKVFKDLCKNISGEMKKK